MKKSETKAALYSKQSPVGKFYHPLAYLADIPAVDCRKQISGIASMPYPADPLVEPEFVGLTYYQVAVIRQAEMAARHGSLDALEFLSDRIIGKPAQVNLNLNADKESYQQFLEMIASEEAKTIDVKAEESWVLE